MENTTLHGGTWAASMAKDCARAMTSIHLSAISCIAPRKINELIDMSQKMPSMSPWEELFSTWVSAKRNGIEVHIWLPTPNRAFPATLQNYTAAQALAKHGVYTHLINGNRLLHAKTCVVDAKIAWIGSGNFTAAAAHHNHEAYVRVESEKIARELIARWELLA